MQLGYKSALLNHLLTILDQSQVSSNIGVGWAGCSCSTLIYSCAKQHSTATYPQALSCSFSSTSSNWCSRKLALSVQANCLSLSAILTPLACPCQEVVGSILYSQWVTVLSAVHSMYLAGPERQHQGLEPQVCPSRFPVQMHQELTNSCWVCQFHGLSAWDPGWGWVLVPRGKAPAGPWPLQKFFFFGGGGTDHLSVAWSIAHVRGSKKHLKLAARTTLPIVLECQTSGHFQGTGWITDYSRKEFLEVPNSVVHVQFQGLPIHCMC